MVASALVGDQLPVRLHHHGVEVLHALQDVGGHGVAGSEWQCVLDQTLNNNNNNIMLPRVLLVTVCPQYCIVTLVLISMEISCDCSGGD